MNKKDLSERDICTKFITPALVAAGFDASQPSFVLCEGLLMYLPPGVRRRIRRAADTRTVPESR